MAKKFIQKAIRRPGQLHKDLGVPQGKKIPYELVRKAAAGKMGPKTAQRARLALTMRGFKHGG